MYTHARVHAPAPILVSTGSPFLTQYAISSAFVLTSSMQSSTYVGGWGMLLLLLLLLFALTNGPNNLSASRPVNISVTASISHHGDISCNLFFSTTAFDCPTSPKAAIACLFSEESVTWSKSIRRTLATPDLTSMFTAWLPTPPRPTTMTKAFCAVAGLRSCWLGRAVRSV